MLFSTKYKKFIYIFIIAFTLFTLLHAATWFFLTGKLLATKEPYYVGDLARISYQLDSLQIRKTEVTLPIKHIQASHWDGKNVDVLSIGDSFSIGGGGGLNPYYQDYIASLYGVRVMNIDRLSDNDDYFENIIIWMNSGLLDRLKPKVIILESVERLALLRFAHEMDWDQNRSSKEIEASMKVQDRSGYPEVAFINTGNYKYFLYNLMFQFSPNAFSYSGGYRFTLDEVLFSAKNSRKLLVYNQDITSLGLVSDDNVQKMNENLNRLSDLLAKKGIKLVFMPIVDKYDLYYDHIIDKPTDKNNFFDLLRPLAKHYYFVDTKLLLKNLLDQKKKDLFHADDSHWSYRGSQEVIRSIPFHELISSNGQ